MLCCSRSFLLAKCLNCVPTPNLVFLVNLSPLMLATESFRRRLGIAMGQRGAGWTDTSQEAMDSAAREHQERMAAKTAYLKVQILDALVGVQ